MNAKNLEFMKEGIKYLGFGEGLNNKLTEELNSGKNGFQLHTENQYGKDKVNYVLDFSKSDKSDMYFFNKYSATLPGQNSDLDKSQTFFIKKNSGVTAKEAYNLLNGRSVNKDLTSQEGEKYNAWLQIDWNQKDDNGNHKFKMIHEAYGYNLENVLSKHPIKELDDPTTKDRLMRSLERGNLHQVTLKKGDSEEKMFIEASPQFKSVNLYDSNLKKVYQENQKKESKPETIKDQKSPDNGPSKQGSVKKEIATEIDDEVQIPKKDQSSKRMKA